MLCFLETPALKFVFLAYYLGFACIFRKRHYTGERMKERERERKRERERERERSEPKVPTSLRVPIHYTFGHQFY